MKALADVMIAALTNLDDMTTRVKDETSFPVLATFALPALAGLSETLSVALSTGGTVSGVWVSWVLRFLCIALAVIVNSALIDLAGQFTGTGKNVRQVVSVINLSVFPAVFILPAILILYSIGIESFGLYALFSVGAFAWSVIIAVRGVSGVYGISHGKALLICMFPGLLFGAVWFVSGMLMLAYLIKSIF